MPLDTKQRADYDAMPQAFSFGGLALFGVMTSWSGAQPRRGAEKQFLKRPGGRVEDMARGMRWLEVDLVFTGASCAADFKKFADAVDANPYGLLVHPNYGRWNAFCWGPTVRGELARATNRLGSHCRFTESELDSSVVQDIEVSPAAKRDNVVNQQSLTQQLVAGMMGQIARAQTLEATARAKLDDALALIDASTAPMELVRSTIVQLSGIQSDVVGKITNVFLQAELLNQTVSDYVSATQDLFDGTSSAGAAQSAQSRLQTIMGQAGTLETACIAAAVSPAGAADGVLGAEELVAACLELDAAIRASQPPVIVFTFKEITNLLEFCRKRYPTKDAQAQTEAILAINRIPNPIAIPAGTKALIPAR